MNIPKHVNLVIERDKTRYTLSVLMDEIPAIGHRIKLPWRRSGRSGIVTLRVMEIAHTPLCDAQRKEAYPFIYQARQGEYSTIEVFL